MLEYECRVSLVPSRYTIYGAIYIYVYMDVGIYTDIYTYICLYMYIYSFIVQSQHNTAVLMNNTLKMLSIKRKPLLHRRCQKQC